MCKFDLQPGDLFAMGSRTHTRYCHGFEHDKGAGECPTQTRCAPFPGTQLAREVLAKCEGRSVLRGEHNVRRLCIVRIDLHLPWSTESA